MTIKKLNVLYVIDNLLIGGAQELVKTLSLNLNKEIFNVSVCSLLDYPGKSDLEPLTKEITEAGVDVATLKMKGWQDRKELKKFLDILREKKVDILHAHLYPTDLWSISMAHFVGVPIKVYSKHETYHNKSSRKRIINAFFYNRYADKALATSDITVDHLIKHELISRNKVQKIFNPIDTAKFDPAFFSGTNLRKEIGIPMSAPVIGNIARFVQRKGIEVFIETAYKVLNKIPQAWFILVGYGENESKYRDMVSNYNLGDHFIFAGPRRDIANILAALDIFLFTPLLGEALPISLLAAMSMKKAIVVSNVCSNREIIIHEISGLLPTPMHWSLTADKLDTDTLTDSVIKLINSDTRREELGKQARLRAEEFFSVRVIMKQLEDLYLSLYYEKKGDC